MVPKGGCHFPDSLLCSQDPEGLSSWPQVDSVLPQRDASHLSLFLCMLGASSAASLCLILSISPALLLTCPWILELLTPPDQSTHSCLLLFSLPQAIPGWARRFILSLPLYAYCSFFNTSIFILQFSCLSQVLVPMQDTRHGRASETEWVGWMKSSKLLGVRLKWNQGSFQ